MPNILIITPDVKQAALLRDLLMREIGLHANDIPNCQNRSRALRLVDDSEKPVALLIVPYRFEPAGAAEGLLLAEDLRAVWDQPRPDPKPQVLILGSGFDPSQEFA